MNQIANVNKETSNKSSDRNQSSLLSTVLWILSTICVCLTITNLYLLVWVWNNLSLTATNSIDLLSSNSHLRLDGQLRSKQALKASQIRSIPDDDDDDDDDRHREDSGLGSSLLMRSNQAIHLMGGSSSDNNNQQQSKASLSVWAQKQMIEMASGWSLRDAHNGQTVMQCQPEAGGSSVCDLMADKFQRLKLANHKGNSVDLRGRSIQTGSVRARQVHSPTNRLELRANGARIRLRSERNSTNIISSDTLRLGHSESAVILDAKQIDLSEVVRFKSPGRTTINANSLNSSHPKNTANTDNNNINNGSTNYKLCICLSAGSTGANTESKRRPNEVIGAAQRNGFIFGLRVDSGLRCAAFSSVYC